MLKVYGEYWTGGIIGNHIGSATISNCYSTGIIEGAQYVGGLIGQIRNGTIEKCYATGNVKGTEYIGGLVGYTSAESGTTTIKNCYSTGKVNGDTYVAALVGASNRAVITNCYAIGEVTGTSTGGLNMVWRGSASVTNSYWIPETTKQNKSTNGTFKTISQMILKATYENWDFEEIWTIDEGNTFAYLKDLPKPDTVNVKNYISE